jgi:dihydroorotate dehydrogenase
VSLFNLGFKLAAPLLHQMDGEAAHRLTIAGLKALPCKAALADDPRLAMSVFGLTFPNPIGLAPGFDKNAEVPDAMLSLGFGAVEVGTVTPKPQAGNAKPRLFRLLEDQAVINRMGFNNDGADVVEGRLRQRGHRSGIVGINIGANKDSADRVADYVAGVKRFGPMASYLTINISSPNTPGLRGLQSRDELSALLDQLNEARRGLAGAVPMLLKIAPDLGEDELRDIAACCADGGVDGVIISNTTLDRAGLRSSKANEAGGLSGKPLFEKSTRVLAQFYQLSGGKIPLVGVGGIDSADAAWTKICAGASLIQIYSGLVYYGPQLVRDITQGLAQKLTEHNLSNLSLAVGRDVNKYG